MRDQQVFSNGQALGTLDSTGVVSTNVFDMELDASGGNTILENDQVHAWFVFEILSTTNTAAGGVEGLDIELRGSDNANMSTAPEYLGTMHLLLAEIVAGGSYAIKVSKTLSKKFLGAWFKATTTSLDGATGVDCYMHVGPVGPNDAIQKVPS